MAKDKKYTPIPKKTNVLDDLPVLKDILYNNPEVASRNYTPIPESQKATEVVVPEADVINQTLPDADTLSAENPLDSILNTNKEEQRSTPVPESQQLEAILNPNKEERTSTPVPESQRLDAILNPKEADLNYTPMPDAAPQQEEAGVQPRQNDALKEMLGFSGEPVEKPRMTMIPEEGQSPRMTVVPEGDKSTGAPLGPEQPPAQQLGEIGKETKESEDKVDKTLKKQKSIFQKKLEVAAKTGEVPETDELEAIGEELKREDRKYGEKFQELSDKYGAIEEVDAALDVAALERELVVDSLKDAYLDKEQAQLGFAKGFGEFRQQVHEGFERRVNFYQNAAQSFDSNRWYKTRTLGQKLLLMASAFLSGGTGTSEQFWSFVNNQVQLDIDEQKQKIAYGEKELEAHDTLFNKLYSLDKDEYAAELAVKNTAINSIMKQLGENEVITKNLNERAKIQNMRAKGELAILTNATKYQNNNINRQLDVVKEQNLEKKRDKTYNLNERKHNLNVIKERNKQALGYAKLKAKQDAGSGRRFKNTKHFWKKGSVNKHGKVESPGTKDRAKLDDATKNYNYVTTYGKVLNDLYDLYTDPKARAAFEKWNNGKSLSADEKIILDKAISYSETMISFQGKSAVRIEASGGGNISEFEHRMLKKLAESGFPGTTAFLIDFFIGQNVATGTVVKTYKNKLRNLQVNAKKKLYNSTAQFVDNHIDLDRSGEKKKDVVNGIVDYMNRTLSETDPKVLGIKDFVKKDKPKAMSYKDRAKEKLRQRAASRYQQKEDEIKNAPRWLK